MTVLILAAIITGSLLTGYSVRESLKSSAKQHLGNTDVLISSGLRYFDATLSYKMILNTNENCVSVLESDGYCQNFSTGVTALNTKIYGITPEYFEFQGNSSILIPPGNVAINQKLAQQLNINKGDEIIIHFKEISPIPANAPFASNKNAAGTKVMRVSQILQPDQSGNFSLGISQIVPMNVYINLSELSSDQEPLKKANRLLVENKKRISPDSLLNILKKSLSLSDIGLSSRYIDKTGGVEIISDRIFIDQEIMDEVKSKLPSARPVITYLANSIRKREKTTPYSFVSALPSSLYPAISSGKNIIINKWLAEDLNASVHDTIIMTWYAPSGNGKLVEKSDDFIINSIVESNGIWGDPSLMPEFPGIAGKSSCSDWDAGARVNMKLIRKKDETYWNNFKGTPKAFLDYNMGKELWGSNFGPITSIRFPESLSRNEIENALTGSFDPGRTGFSISDVRAETMKAAQEGVDFSTLFLSLGFFIILSCIILLILSVSLFFESRKDQVVTFYSLGFGDRWIEKLLFLETLAIAVTGAIPGIFAGSLINWLIIKALNSVWSGAVQTSTLNSYFTLYPLLMGFISTIFICGLILKIKVWQFLKSLKKPETGLYTGHSKKTNFYLLIIFIIVTVLILISSIIFKGFSTPLSFAGGIIVFLTLILSARYFFIGGFRHGKFSQSDQSMLSSSYYSFNPSQAITPVIFIAAGVFAVFITGVNRLDISDKMKEPSGGTGGYLLWCESAVPVKQDLNSTSGRIEFGLDDDSLKNLTFIQATKSSGDDASCLNLNHVSAPPLLGLNPTVFIAKGSFTFASVMKDLKKENPWKTIERPPANNIIYGIADQTVLQWGLKISPGDTLIMKSESGQPLKIIIAGGLKSSVFQGYVIIGSDNFEKFYPSVPGSSVFLAAGNPVLTSTYQNILKQRFSNYGFSAIPASDRLTSFSEVTNTYLSVFTTLGAFGMILGVAGLGFVLLRNLRQRRKEFALMIATGHSIGRLRRMILKEQIQILVIGLFTGAVSAITATIPSLKNGSEIPWAFLLIMFTSVFLTGFIALKSSVKMISGDVLIASLRKE